jgi:hypothetical protein
MFTAPTVSMGHEKRKGKEVVVEKSIRKRTRAEKEAERAELVAKAARGACLRACSFAADQGAAQQRQSWQGHQGHGTADRERFI